MFSAAASLNHHRQMQDMEKRSKRKGRPAGRAVHESETNGVLRPPKSFKKMTAGEYMNWMNEAGGGAI